MKWGILLMALVIAGCNQTTLTKETVIVVSPPASLFVGCEYFSKSSLPNPDTLTNRQLVVLIGNLIKRVNTCASNQQAIKEYIENAKKIYEERVDK